MYQAKKELINDPNAPVLTNADIDSAAAILVQSILLVLGEFLINVVAAAFVSAIRLVSRR